MLFCLLFTSDKTIVYRLLSTRSLVGIGLISYSAYLWHQPLMAFARHRLLNTPPLELMIFLSGLSLLLAYFSWKYVEMPFRRKDGAIKTKPLVIICVITILALLGISIVGAASKGFPQRFSEEKRAKLAAIEDITRWGVYERQPYTKDNPFFEQYPVEGFELVGNQDTEPSFVIMGDSHAQVILNGLSEKGQLVNTSGLMLSMPTCMPVNIGENKYTPYNERCNKARNSFFGLLQSNQVPETVILVARWARWMEGIRFDNQEGGIEQIGNLKWGHHLDLPYQEAMSIVFKETVEMILDSGRKVILVYIIPEVGWDVKDYMVKSILYEMPVDNNTATTSFDVFNQRNHNIFNTFDTITDHPNLKRIYPHKIFCDSHIKERCITFLDGKPLYTDDNHLSEYGSKMVAEKVLETMKELQ